MYAHLGVLRLYPQNLQRIMPTKGSPEKDIDTLSDLYFHSIHTFINWYRQIERQFPSGILPLLYLIDLTIMIPVQFITHTTAEISYEQSAYLALEGGCQWIQLRMKGCSDEEVEPIAVRLLKACQDAGATFILDDRVELCKKIQAHGVHLGKNDMPVHEARAFLGEDFLIGGTANTFEDIKKLKYASADYVGCGPFRFTTTKDNLSPIIGLEGYREIMKQENAENLRIPICAIGGIMLEDVMPIIETGIQGIAVSGSVLRAENPVKMMESFLNADE